jgi:hypothetical protein
MLLRRQFDIEEWGDVADHSLIDAAIASLVGADKKNDDNIDISNNNVS